MRFYSHFVLPPDAKTFQGTLLRTKWTLLHPGQARLFNAWQKLLMPDQGFQEALEELGYSFPTNCFASNPQEKSVSITHYPSMLQRIEKDMQMKPYDKAIPVEGRKQNFQ